MSPPKPTSRKLKVLLIAEAANPDWTSVPLVGWNIYRSISRIADVHLVTHIRNRGAIEAQGLKLNQDFTTIDNERIASPLYRLASLLRRDPGKGWTIVTALSSLAYYSFEQMVWTQFKGRLGQREFDIVHRVTPLSPTSQSLIAKQLHKLGIPFVVGPLNGGVPWPAGFVDRQHAENEWLGHFRRIYRLMPGYTSMRRYSSAILVGSKFTLSDLPGYAQKRAVYIPENGVDAEALSEPSKRVRGAVLRCAFVGRLVAYKGADMLIDAAEEYLRAKRIKLEIIGDGPERPALQTMIDRARIGDSVTLHGAIPHQAVLALLRDCDAFIFPSIREFGGGVVVEAMGLGIATVVADYAGPAELVSETTGIKVAFSDRDSLVAGIKAAIDQLLQTPSLIESLSANGRQRVMEHFTWDAKAQQILQVYEAIVSGLPLPS